MNYFWGALGWIWSKRKFIAITLLSAVLFFAWLFPFGDLSAMVTAQVAKGSGVYLQFETMDLSLIPAPAITGHGVSVETSTLPPLEAKWLKLAPAWLTVLFNSWTIKKAASGDVEAAAKLSTRIGVNISAEGILGGDADIHLRPGSNNEQGNERSKVSIYLDKLNINDVQKWSELSVKLQGELTMESTVQFTPGFLDQPEGEVELKVKEFKLPATTIGIPFNGTNMDMNIPTLTLDHVVLRGRLVGGKFTIEEGAFGGPKDPIYGRIKGQMSLRIIPMGGQVQPQFGPYNLTVDLNVSASAQKEIGIAFLLFDSAKSAGPNGGAKYLFQAAGDSIGMTSAPPRISRLNSF